MIEDLVCPRDKTQLVAEGDRLTCSNGHKYPVIEGVPVLLIEEERPTHFVFHRSLEFAEQGSVPEANFDASIDPVVQSGLAASCGNLYKHMTKWADDYPIPEIRLPDGHGQRFLELGSSWGRWCVSAARRGYTVVGVDPSLEGVLAARRVAESLGVKTEYVVADARHLPFPDDAFDVVFSFSVLQHFAKDDVRSALAEAGRVLRPGGTSLIQLANRFGLRSFYNRLRRGFKPEVDFDVRYWTPHEIEETFNSLIGPTEIEVDGFFSLNAQRSDVRLLRPFGRAVVYTSDALRRVAVAVRPLEYVADSLYARSRRDR